MKNFYRSISIGLIITAVAMLMPYLLIKDFVNTSEWHWSIQWLVVWFAISGVIYSIDKISSDIKNI